MKELQGFLVWYCLFGVVFNLKDFLSFCSESAALMLRNYGLLTGMLAIVLGLVVHVVLWPIVLVNSCKAP